MTWWQILGYGCLGGFIVGGVFLAIGMWLDRRAARKDRKIQKETDQ